MTKISRRTFLQTGAAATLVGCGMGAPDPLPAGSRVVVVGAGFAGIGAAELLLDNGFKVELIEARSRIGGRALTTPLGDTYVDLGANWLAADRENYLQAHAEAAGLIGAQADFSDAALADGGDVSDLDTDPITADVESAMTSTYLWYKTRRFFGARPRLASVASTVGGVLEKHGSAGTAVQSAMGVNYAAEIENLSLLAMFTGSDSSAGSLPLDVTVKGGMGGLAELLLDKATPSFEEEARVVQRTSSGVSVITNKRTIVADACIVTVPIGVLKAGDITFDPELPKHHRDALAGLGMGALVKCWLLYDEVVWPASRHSNVLANSAEFPIVVDFSVNEGRPLLLGFAYGEQARRIEDLGIDAAVPRLLEAIRSDLGWALPEPAAVAMSDWNSDPLAGGAYMYQTPDSRADDHLQLREPIAERIFLAGEGLAEYFGYVDTAWADGRRAAGLIIGG